MIWLTPEMARRIISGEGPFSLDLGITWRKDVELSEEILRSIAEQRSGIFMVGDGKVVKLEIRTEHYYKLEGIPPVLWIDGIKMHEGDVLKRSMEKTKFARGRVLDICTGLGYTAIEASRRAREVITIEKDKNVIELAKHNPWSQELFSSPIIKIVIDDAFNAVKKLHIRFDSIIHDPPRFSMAGKLYSLTFYRELFRLLKPGGFLYHYVGSPGIGRGKKVRAGIKRRLGEAGFRVIGEDKYGFFAMRE